MSFLEFLLKEKGVSPGQGAQLVSASFQYTKVRGSIPSQGTHKKQPMSAWIEGQQNQCLFASLFISLSPSKLKCVHVCVYINIYINI